MGKKSFDYSVELEEGQELYEQSSEEAREKLEALGINVYPEIPEYRGELYDGRLPPSIHKMSMEDLAELLGVSTEWADYVGGLHQATLAQKKNLDKQLSLAKAKIRQTKSGTRDEREDATICDRRYVQIDAEYIKAVEMESLLEHASAAARRSREFVSRAITALQAEMEASTRHGNVSSGRSGSKRSRLSRR